MPEWKVLYLQNTCPPKYNKCDLTHYKFYEFLVRKYLEWAQILTNKHN